MRVAFTVLGEPQGKGRPIFSKRGNFVSARTPEKTKAYEAEIQGAFLEKYGREKFPKGSLLDLRVMAYYSIPKSTSQKKRKDMVEQKIRPAKKPDVDNVLKVVADALNGVAYEDDASVVEMQVRKFYGDVARIEVIVQSC